MNDPAELPASLQHQGDGAFLALGPAEPPVGQDVPGPGGRSLPQIPLDPLHREFGPVRAAGQPGVRRPPHAVPPRGGRRLTAGLAGELLQPRGRSLQSRVKRLPPREQPFVGLGHGPDVAIGPRDPPQDPRLTDRLRGAAQHRIDGVGPVAEHRVDRRRRHPGEFRVGRLEHQTDEIDGFAGLGPVPLVPGQSGEVGRPTEHRGPGGETRGRPVGQAEQADLQQVLHRRRRRRPDA
ncbi:MAG: hypothetical protein ACYTEV_10485, partial [Planctomycetota bacterium]